MASYHVLHHLGWMTNFQKTKFTPTQDFQFIGMQFRIPDFTVAPMPKMQLKVQAIVDHWRWVTTVSALDVHRMLGTTQYMAPLVPRGRLFFPPIQWCALTKWDQSTEDWDQWICIPDWVIRQFAWWASPAVCQGLSFRSPETDGCNIIHRCFPSGMWGSTGRPEQKRSMITCAGDSWIIYMAEWSAWCATTLQ